MLQPGDCSPSRSVVSKMVIVSDMVLIPASPRRKSGVLSDGGRLEDSTDSRLPLALKRNQPGDSGSLQAEGESQRVRQPA